MDKIYEQLNILVMPTDNCNMNCIYCYHNTHFSNTEKMSIDTLERLMRITLPNFQQVNFIWHGGEPLIMGLEFYKKVIDLEKKYNINNAKITNRIQTNLTLMTKEIAEFLKENNFGCSSSFDGISNEYTRGNSNKILNGRKLLRDVGTGCGNICVVSQANVNNLIETYHFFKENKISYKTNMFIQTGNIETDNKLFVSNEDYVNKMKEFFDYWLYDTSCNISVAYFIMFLKFILKHEKTSCNFRSCLGKWVGIKHNGDIVPCNRYFPDEYKYGNVNDYGDISQCFHSKGFENLLIKAIQRREKCKSCKIYDFCNGGCNNVALNQGGIENNKGTFCLSLIELYTYIESAIKKIQCNSLNELKNKINPTVLKLLNDM